MKTKKNDPSKKVKEILAILEKFDSEDKELLAKKLARVQIDAQVLHLLMMCELSQTQIFRLNVLFDLVSSDALASISSIFFIE